MQVNVVCNFEAFSYTVIPKLQHSQYGHSDVQAVAGSHLAVLHQKHMPLQPQLRWGL